MNHDRPNRILEFLTAPAQPEGEASRANRRRPSSAMAQISWPEGDGWRTVRARLRDISRAGAGAVATTAPPLTTRGRLRLVEGEGTPWIEAEVIGVEQVKPRRFRVRLRFLEPCPSFLLRLAVLGAVPEEAEGDASGVTFEWVTWHPGQAE